MVPSPAKQGESLNRAALSPLVPDPPETDDCFTMSGQTPAEVRFHARREELRITTPCQEMDPRHFWADEDRNTEILREGAVVAAKRVLPGVVACRSCPLLPECYRMGTEGIPGRDGVYGGEYFNMIPATGRPTTKQDGVRRRLHKMLSQEGVLKK